MSFWAKDSFRGKDGVLGGTIVDGNRPWAARDKVQHVICSFLYALALDLANPTPAQFYVGHAAGQLAWEIFEDLFEMDEPSWRDLVANHIGLGLAVGYLLLRHALR